MTATVQGKLARGGEEVLYAFGYHAHSSFGFSFIVIKGDHYVPFGFRLESAMNPWPEVRSHDADRHRLVRVEAGVA